MPNQGDQIDKAVERITALESKASAQHEINTSIRERLENTDDAGKETSRAAFDNKGRIDAVDVKASAAESKAAAVDQTCQSHANRLVALELRVEQLEKVRGIVVNVAVAVTATVIAAAVVYWLGLKK